MSSVILVSEIQTLISESKRKKPEIKKTAETSLSSLQEHKDLSASELGRTLRKDAAFSTPFILACASVDAKLVRPGINSLLQLLSLRGIDPSKLPDILKSLQPNISLNQEIQLRVLQCLQKLDENYTSDLNGSLVTKCLNICSALQTKDNDTVSQISRATFQQIVVSLFDKIKSSRKSSETSSNDDSEASTLLDGYNILQDLCFILDNVQPAARIAVTASPPQALEIVGIVLKGSNTLFRENQDFASLIEKHLLPFLLHQLDERSNISKLRQILRLSRHVLLNHLEQFADQSKAIFSELSRQAVLERSAFWKRAMCLEVFVELLSSDAFVSRLLLVQGPTKDQRTSLLGYHFTSLVTLAKSSPETLGWNISSQISFSESEIQLDSLSSSPYGLLSFFPCNMVESTMRSRLIDQADYKQSLELPRFYVHNLVLEYVIQLCSDLDRSVIQTAFPQGQDPNASKKKRKVKDASSKEFHDLVDEDGHTISKEVQIYHSMLENYQDMIVDMLGIFVWAVLDEDTYLDYAVAIRRLMVTLQLFKLESKLPSVFEVLRNGCLPVRAVSWAKERLKAEDAESYISELGHHRLVCTKTVLEIAISVGFLTKSSTWYLIWDTLALSSDFAYGDLRMESEYEKDIALLLNAGFEKFATITVSMHISALDEILCALVSLLRQDMENISANDTSKSAHVVEWLFNILRRNAIKLTKDAKNCRYLNAPFSVGRDLVRQRRNENVSLETASILNSSILTIIEAAQDKQEILKLAFDLFFSVVREEMRPSQHSSYHSIEYQLHRLGFDLLNNFLQSFGDKIDDWTVIFELISSVFVAPTIFDSDSLLKSLESGISYADKSIETKSEKLVQTGFSILRTACADFRHQIIESALRDCVNTLRLFVAQETDLNISLEALSTFWSFGSDLAAKTESHLPNLTLHENQYEGAGIVAHADRSTSQSNTKHERFDLIGTDLSVDYTGNNEVAAMKSISHWRSILDTLVCLTINPRPNIRSTSLQILVKILSMRKSYTDLLSFEALFRLLTLNLIPLRSLKSSAAPQSETHSQDWSVSMMKVLEQSASVIHIPQYEFSASSDLKKCLNSFLKLLSQYVETRWLEALSAAMHALSYLVSRCVHEGPEDQQTAMLAWSIWCNAAFSKQSYPGSGVLQPHEVQLSWAKCFFTIKSKMQVTSSELIKSLQLFKKGLELDLLPTSFSDVESLSPYQTEVIKILNMSQSPFSSSSLLIGLSFSVIFSRFGLDTLTREVPNSLSTYFAFSKAALNNLKHLIISHHKNSILYVSGPLLFSSLETLALFIQTKAEQRSKGSKDVALWKNATICTNEVLMYIIKACQSSRVSLSTKHDIFSGVISILYAVAAAGKNDGNRIESFEDESYDIEVLLRLHPMLVDSLGADGAFDSIRALYSLYLFEESKIHNLMPMANSTEPFSFESFNPKVRRGQTYDVLPKRRTRIPFTCLGLLVNLALVTRQDLTESTPYSVARQLFVVKSCDALIAYIADQPLRGRQPLPKLHRRELVLILNGLTQLHQALLRHEAAFRSWTQESAVVLPFLAQAIPVAQRDPEMLKLLSQATLTLSSRSSAAKLDPTRVDGNKSEPERSTPPLSPVEVDGKPTDLNTETLKEIEALCAEIGILDVERRLEHFRQNMRELQTRRGEKALLRARSSPLEGIIAVS